MRPPITLEPWQSSRELRRWVDAPESPAQQRRRLAVWMASQREFTTQQIATTVLVTPDAVGRWLRHYNAVGPEQFDGPGRGGRRRARLSVVDESAVLAELKEQAAVGHLLTVPQIQHLLEQRTDEPWPLKTVYDLLQRHEWRRVQPRPRHVRADVEAQARFKKSSAASSRRKSAAHKAAAFASSSKTRAASGG